MDWIRLQQLGVQTYATVSEWCYTHQIATDIVAGTLVVGSVLALHLRRERVRRRLRRIWWGKTMRRTKNRLAYEKTMIAFRLEEMLIDMAYLGELTDKSAEEWRQSFKNHYNLDELQPRKSQFSVKKAIRGRLKRGVHLIKPHIPGGKNEVKHDPAYKPKAAKVGMEKSKWAA
jgi:hypothetical protein